LARHFHAVNIHIGMGKKDAPEVDTALDTRISSFQGSSNFEMRRLLLPRTLTEM
jgi:hypothetical protein